MQNSSYRQISRHPSLRWGIFLLVLGVIVSQVLPIGRTNGSALAASGPMYGSPVHNSGQLRANLRLSFADAVDKSIASVVNISAETNRSNHPMYRMNPYGQRGLRGQPPTSSGSGVIVKSDGIILTNNHVVEGATKIHVKLHDGRSLEAEIVGTDKKTDIAVLRIPAKKLPAISLGDSRYLRIGDVVLAIGNPFGVGQTVTMGIVSALQRTNVNITDYENFIQTDAPINPGNSGGPLVTTDGLLVGINTAILSRSGGSQGIGFAIPSSMALPIMETILKEGRVVRGWLGVGIQDIGPELQKALGFQTNEGALVSYVEPQSPADRGGIRRGDVIVSVDGTPTRTVQQLRNEVALIRPGTVSQLSIIRDGRRMQRKIKIGNLDRGITKRPSRLSKSTKMLAGIEVKRLSRQMAREEGLPRDAVGLVVTAIQAGSPAEDVGMEPGDVILEVNQVELDRPNEFYTLARKLQGPAVLLVYREGHARYVVIQAQR